MSFQVQSFVADSGPRPRAMVERDIELMPADLADDLARFSRLRHRFRADDRSYAFALCDMIVGPLETEPFAPILIYGAGVDYSNPRWPDLSDLLETKDLFEACVHLFCERVLADGSRMLVILPPEDAPEDHYRPHMGHSRARTILFNALWRSAAPYHPGIDVFAMSGFAHAEDLAEVGQYHPGLLRRLASLVDDWVDNRRLPKVRAV